SIVNAGSSVFEQLPHGSLFHTSAGSINMDIGERFKLIPYEALIMGMIGCYTKISEENVFKLQQAEENLQDFVFEDANENSTINIDKAWHAIHFTLTGCPFGGDDDNIFSKLVLSGNILMEIDGEFPVMLITANDVKKLSKAMNSLEEQAFRKRFNINEMLENNIYPVMNDESEDDFFEYVWANLIELKKFIQEASNDGLAVIFFIM
ncbi:YfbM family protein, partial [Clostridioides difficile]